MRSAIRAIAAATLCLTGTLACAQVQTAWTRSPGGVTVSRDAADNVFTAYGDANLGGDITLTKRSPAGDLLWQATVDNTDPSRSEIANWLATDAAGNTYVAGTITAGLSNPVPVNALLMKFGPTGQLLWRRVLGAPGDGSTATRVVLDPLGQAYVVGLGTGTTAQVGAVRKLSADGTELWAWFDTHGLGRPVYAKWTPDQQLLIVGRSPVGSGISNGFARLDAQGTLVWVLAGVTSQTTGDAAGDTGGNTYVVNGLASASGSVLSKFASNGSLLWQRSHPMSAQRVEVRANGSAVLAGLPAAGSGAAFAAYSPQGGLLWSNPDADGPAVNQLLHSQLLLDAAGNAYLSGSTLFQMSVTKVRADGNTDWTAQLGGGSSTTGIVLGRANQLYVAGNSAVVRLDQRTPAPPIAATVDVALGLADAPDPVDVNGTLAYTATVRNLGTGPAPGVQFQLSLPADMVWRSTTPSQGTCSGILANRCALGTLAPGATASVVVTVQARKRGTYSASASASTTASDVNPANNAASVTTTVGR